MKRLTANASWRFLWTTIGLFWANEELRTRQLAACDVFPGFSTDWQQLFAALLTQADGISLIHETVYENRFGYLQALNALGAKTQLTAMCSGGLPCRYKDRDYPHSAIIIGSAHFHGAGEIDIPGLRTGLGYVIAASVAADMTILHYVELLERGYGNIISRLANLNLDITTV